MKRSIFFVILVGLVLFSSCKTFEPVMEIPLPLKIPENFSIDAGGIEAMESWWFFFGSDELNGLIKDAVENNFDLKSVLKP